MKIGGMKESKFLKKEDFGTTGQNVVIAGIQSKDVSMADQAEEMKHVIFFDGFNKGMVLNWTNIQLIAQVTGSEETDDWKGETVNVYADPTVAYAGKLIGGLRVRAPMAASQPAPSENPAAGVEQQSSGNDFDDSLPDFM